MAAFFTPREKDLEDDDLEEDDLEEDDLDEDLEPPRDPPLLP